MPTAGRLAAGEQAPGRRTAGELAAGELAAGKMAAGKMAAGEFADGEFADGGGARGERVPGDVPRQRALVAQATGWIAGRLGCTISAAAEHLAKLARETETTPAEAAALLLSETTAHALPYQPVPAQTPHAPAHNRPPHTAPPHAAPAHIAPPHTVPAHTVPAHAVPAQNRPGPEPGFPALAVPAGIVDLLPVPAMALSPVAGDGGEITDFVIERRNSEATTVTRSGGGDTVTGQPLSRVIPGLREGGLLSIYTEAFRSGRPLRLDLFPFRLMGDERSETFTVDIRGQRIGDWLLVTWNAHNASGDRSRRLASAEQLDGLGWAEWDLFTRAATWSHEVYAMHGRPPHAGPPSFDEYLRLVHPDDAEAVSAAFRGLSDDPGGGQAEYRVLTDGAVRYLKVATSAVYDAAGKPRTLRAVIRDVTESRQTELALTTARRKIERERREATLRMQQAILPTTDEEFRIGRYEIGVRYTPAQSGNRVGGDWYEARRESDGDAIIAIGDVAGHGLSAAAGMARVGNALRGLTITGEPADKVLRWLNKLVCADEIPERVASVAVGSLSQDPPRLRWAQAGHPPPVLIRDGEARLLARPAGLLIGTIPDTEYELASEDLMPGDLLLFYTDGLIERRGRDIDVGLVELLDAAGRCSDETTTGFAAELARRLNPGAEDDVSLLVVRVASPPPGSRRSAVSPA